MGRGWDSPRGLGLDGSLGKCGLCQDPAELGPWTRAQQVKRRDAYPEASTSRCRHEGIAGSDEAGGGSGGEEGARGDHSLICSKILNRAEVFGSPRAEAGFKNLVVAVATLV